MSEKIISPKFQVNLRLSEKGKEDTYIPYFNQESFQASFGLLFTPALQSRDKTIEEDLDAMFQAIWNVFARAVARGVASEYTTRPDGVDGWTQEDVLAELRSGNLLFELAVEAPKG